MRMPPFRFAACLAFALTAFDAAAQAGPEAAVVDAEKIKTNKGNLNIPLYVAPADTGEQITLDQALAQLREAHQHVQS